MHNDESESLVLRFGRKVMMTKDQEGASGGDASPDDRVARQGRVSQEKKSLQRHTR